MKRRISALLAGVFVLASATAACGGTSPETVPEQAREPTRQPVREETTREERTEEGPRARQRATYYGEEFAGSPTASGEPFDPRRFTAAHKTLPFGTVLEVCYRGCVRVKINDRNPRSAADLDLSLAAAERIGLVPAGEGVVVARVVERE